MSYGVFGGINLRIRIRIRRMQTKMFPDFAEFWILFGPKSGGSCKRVRLLVSILYREIRAHLSLGDFRSARRAGLHRHSVVFLGNIPGPTLRGHEAAHFRLFWKKLSKMRQIFFACGGLNASRPRGSSFSHIWVEIVENKWFFSIFVWNSLVDTQKSTAIGSVPQF